MKNRFGIISLIFSFIPWVSRFLLERKILVESTWGWWFFIYMAVISAIACIVFIAVALAEREEKAYLILSFIIIIVFGYASAPYTGFPIF